MSSSFDSKYHLCFFYSSQFRSCLQLGAGIVSPNEDTAQKKKHKKTLAKLSKIAPKFNEIRTDVAFTLYGCGVRIWLGFCICKNK